jgi:hypothetical protein
VTVNIVQNNVEELTKLKTNKYMSITAKLDLLAQEIFGEFGYNTLTKYEQQLIMTLYELDEIKDYTDLSILK